MFEFQLEEMCTARITLSSVLFFIKQLIVHLNTSANYIPRVIGIKLKLHNLKSIK